MMKVKSLMLVLGGSLAFQASLVAEEGVGIISENDSEAIKHRLMWIENPSSEATIGWVQESGKPGVVHYGKVDQKRKHHLYEKSQQVHRTVPIGKGVNCFVKLTGLEPDTAYFYVIKDASGVSRRLKFHTAPATNKAITFINGGDSRSNRKTRQELNKIVAKLKPLFVSFSGDMIGSPTHDQWDKWFEDWQLTISEDGTIIPIVAHRGNHENKKDAISKEFDTPADVYYAFTVGKNLLRYYALNSEIPAEGAQSAWLDQDLGKHAGSVTYTAAGYHKPMRPHVSKKKEGTNPYKWAPIFYKHGVDLAFESDSHCIKRTQPLRPASDGAEGFVAAPNDPKATVYTGEGCWGAPLRKADDAKSWTLDCAAFNGFDWVSVNAESMQIKTVKLEKTGALKVEAVEQRNSFKTPKGLSLWQAKGGEVLTIRAKKK
ncbi:fibronectin type III domain-containing protein [Rubritalea tangerina]|uniref:Fibronectin type III domain-containing protein n=1 Tax=Rubritalea tangerina TaxID=430798 RepID=A0ABW4ZAD0_9BACT